MDENGRVFESQPQRNNIRDMPVHSAYTVHLDLEILGKMPVPKAKQTTQTKTLPRTPKAPYQNGSCCGTSVLDILKKS